MNAVTKLAVAAVVAALPTGATAQGMQNAATCQHGFAEAALMILGLLFVIGLFLEGVRFYSEVMKQPSRGRAKGKGRGNRQRVVATQSQVHYTWRNQQPRFQPLGADGHGAWPQHCSDNCDDEQESTGGLSRLRRAVDGATEIAG